MHNLQDQKKCIVKFIARQPIWHNIMAKKKFYLVERARKNVKLESFKLESLKLESFF